VKHGPSADVRQHQPQRDARDARRLRRATAEQQAGREQHKDPGIDDEHEIPRQPAAVERREHARAVARPQVHEDVAGDADQRAQQQRQQARAAQRSAQQQRES
jgi:hypothetical protein